MQRGRTLSLLLAAPSLLVTAGLLAAGCAAPLGPGYAIERQEVQLTLAPDALDTVRVRAAYRLRNTGKAALDGLDLALPAALGGEEIKVRALVEGREVRARRKEPRPGDAAPHDEATPAGLTIPFDPPWPQNRRLALVIEYEVRGPSHLSAFDLSSTDWFPRLRAPQGFLARGQARAETVDIRLNVPAGWHALTSGQPRGVRRRGDTQELRFRLREDDFAPFFVAGRYHEHQVEQDGLTLYFWTIGPSSPQSARRAAEYIARRVKFYEDTFGPRHPRRRMPVWVAEIDRHAGRTELIVGAMPNVALMGITNQPVDLGSDTAWRLAEDGLVLTWFWHIAQSGDDAPGLGRDLAGHAAILADEALGSGERRENRMRVWCREYNALAGHFIARGEEQLPLIQGLRSSDRSQRHLARTKQPLLLMALERRVGQDAFTQAIRRVIQGMRGSTFGWNELRSALEAESGQDLAEMFRVWLGQPGLPEEFCKKYEKNGDQ